eukprot:TRINITY_DN116725_c0_g1_i1.p1 TRINITY_DN116725_c0_g1~~TRINITY_DN116725_c0_g1_i1.p1  ORF type:complete len:259 (-),score=41.19 TRINITY_DN116725_c0_g1_i1:118-894(-)
MAPHSDAYYKVVSFPHLKLGLNVGAIYARKQLEAKCREDLLGILHKKLQDKSVFVKLENYSKVPGRRPVPPVQEARDAKRGKVKQEAKAEPKTSLARVCGRKVQRTKIDSSSPGSKSSSSKVLKPKRELRVKSKPIHSSSKSSVEEVKQEEIKQETAIEPSSVDACETQPPHQESALRRRTITGKLKRRKTTVQIIENALLHASTRNWRRSVRLPNCSRSEKSLQASSRSSLRRSRPRVGFRATFAPRWIARIFTANC